jgi:hypothetical protein
MVHDTPARKSARMLKTEAQVLAAEAMVLAEIAGMEQEAQVRRTQVAGLREQAKELQGKARLEDLTVREEPLVKQTKKGERTYYRWVASWREGAKTKKVYLGSCRKINEAEALKKAKRMKAEALGLKRINVEIIS